MKKTDLIRYVFGGLFILSGLGGMEQSVLAGVFLILFGVSLFPNIYKKLNISSNKAIPIIIPIVLFFISCMFMPTPETEEIVSTNTDETIENVLTNEINEENEVVNSVNEVVENIVKENIVVENQIDELKIENEEIEKEEVVEQNVKQEDVEEENNVVEEQNSVSTETTTEQVEKTETITKTAKSTEKVSSTNHEVVETHESTVVDSSPISTYAEEETVVNTYNVWIPQSGKKYHSNSGCSNMKNPSQVTESEAISRGYTPCKKCY